jgi:anti-sigma regulatory factor (Ser/Thr protein kinase)
LHKTEQIALRAALGELERLQGWLEAICQSYQLDERVSFQLDLCLTELVTNVISYAYPAGAPEDNAVLVLLTRDPADVAVTVAIIDQGIEFNPLAYVPAAPAHTLEAAQIGGRGLLLVRKFAKQLQYQRGPDTNRLSFTIPTPGSAV